MIWNAIDMRFDTAYNIKQKLIVPHNEAKKSKERMNVSSFGI